MSWPKIAVRTVDNRLSNRGLNLTHQKIMREISPLKEYKYRHITNQTNCKRLTKCYLIDFGALPDELVYAGLLDGQLTIVTVAKHPHMFIQRPFSPSNNKMLNDSLCDLEIQFTWMCFDVIQPGNGDENTVLAMLRKHYMVIDDCQYFTSILKTKN